jgi:hypothetical protein
MSFTPGFICWAEERVNETVVVDAVMPSEAVFLATHRPARIFKREIGQTKGGVWCDEERLLKDFLAPNIDLLLMPIIGASGTGKSNLIRWLRARIEPGPTRKVVYIPKYGTNLRSVIELILADMSGPIFDDLRNELAKAADSLNELEAPERLMFELALRISHAPPETPGGEGGRTNRYRQLLITELPKLLKDHVFTTHLLQAGGVIDRLATEALRGRTSEQKEHPYEFVEADIPTDVIEAKQAGAAAQQIYAQLVGSPQLRAAAVSLLNEQLEPAIRNLFGMGGRRLSEVMRGVRAALLEQNTELILLIEDFALLQGIQRELLDAIIQAPKEGNVQLLCPIRTAMAVTAGYFDSLDTVRTRAAFGGYAYSLDVPYAEGGDIALNYAIDLIGGYLNAARLGSSVLDAALARTGAGGGAVGRKWIPNKCDKCPLQQECHDSFGTSVDGYGLYPFNRPALDRMLKARTKGNFDPRDVLGRIVRLTLSEQEQDLADGRYPAANYLKTYSDPTLPTMDPEIVATLKHLDPVDHRRRVDVLTFWGNCPDKVTNLRKGIHEAFRLTELDVETPVETPEPLQASTATKETSKEDARLREDLEEIRKWATGEYNLSQDLAGRLRRWIHGAVVARIEWNEEFWRENDLWTSRSNGRVFRASSIQIVNALGGGAVPQGALRIDIPTSNDHERLLRGLVQFHVHGHWNFARGDGPAAFRLYCAALDEWAGLVLAGIRSTDDGGTSWDPVKSTVGMLLLGARVLGLRGARSNLIEDLVNAIFEPTPGTNSAERGPLWSRLIAACTERVGSGDNREQLRDRLFEYVAVAQGTGRPQAVDAARLLPALRDFKTSWMPEDPGPLAPAGVQKNWTELTNRLRPALDEELSRLTEWQAIVAENFGSERDPAPLATALQALVTNARQLGVLGPPSLALTIDEAIKSFRKSRMSVIDEVAEVIAQAGEWPLGRLAGELAENRDLAIRQLQEFVPHADAILRDTRNRLAQQDRALKDAAGGVNGYVDVRDELSQITNLLGGELEPNSAAASD